MVSDKSGLFAKNRGVYYYPPPWDALVRFVRYGFFAQFRCILNPLESALTRPLGSVHYTGLAEKLSLLESALTRNMGGGGVMVNQPSDKDEGRLRY